MSIIAIIRICIRFETIFCLQNGKLWKRTSNSQQISQDDHLRLHIIARCLQITFFLLLNNGIVFLIGKPYYHIILPIET